MISVLKNHEHLSRTAADFFSKKVTDAINVHGLCTAALSGGETPKRMYEILSGRYFKNKIPWEKVHVFWGDERCVSPDDPRSNFRMARNLLLKYVPTPGLQVHPIECSNSPETDALIYENLLRDHFHEWKVAGFDIVLLGLGTDGHTASLFPYSDALKEKERWAVHVFVPEQNLYRITLTPVIINQSDNILFLVSGRDKAGVLKEVLKSPDDAMRLPAQLISPYKGTVHWMLDEEAASELGDLIQNSN